MARDLKKHEISFLEIIKAHSIGAGPTRDLIKDRTLRRTRTCIILHHFPTHFHIILEQKTEYAVIASGREKNFILLCYDKLHPCIYLSLKAN